MFYIYRFMHGFFPSCFIVEILRAWQKSLLTPLACMLPRPAFSPTRACRLSEITQGFPTPALFSSLQ